MELKNKLDKVYQGKVVDNKDPKKKGRIKIQVIGLNDKNKIDDLPWASPIKDTNGNNINVPDVGKIINVTFDNGDINKPFFESAEHYNINLSDKLTTLSYGDYTSINSVMFDHKSQLYSTDSEGLIMDYKMTKINVNDNDIKLTLKDNYGTITLGTEKADQKIILGNNFTEWFGRFLDCFMKASAQMTSMGMPCFPTAELVSLITEYKEKLNSKFLSNNVFANDNNKIEKVERPANGQIGDEWTSTVEQNNLTTKEPITFKPKDGTVEDTQKLTTTQSTDIATKTLTDNGLTPSNITSTDNTQQTTTQATKEVPKDISILKQILTTKNYTLYEDPYKLNIISIRYQCADYGDRYTNTFDDKLYVFYKKDDGEWEITQYQVTTVPGLKFSITSDDVKNLNQSIQTVLTPYIDTKKDIYLKSFYKATTTDFKGVRVLAPSQYINAFYIDKNLSDNKTFLPSTSCIELYYYDDNMTNCDVFKPSNFASPTQYSDKDNHLNMIGIHEPFIEADIFMRYINNLSNSGDTVFARKSDYQAFIELCEAHKSKYDNIFTYTLCTKNDWLEAEKIINLSKDISATI